MNTTDATIPLDSLIEATSNPNRMEPEKAAMLTEAIRRKGFLQPALVRPKGDKYEIIDGHHRCVAAREAGLTEVPCVIAHDCDDPTAIALRIGMNRLRGDLDLTSTAELVQGLLDWGWELGDLTITGFSGDEVSDLVRSLQSIEVEPKIFDDMDSEEEDRDAPVAKPFALELVFKTREELKRAKKALKKAAGKNGDYAKGLLRLMGE